MLKKYLWLIIASILLTAVTSSAAFAVISPIEGVATPNGKYVFIPNQIGTARIRVVDTSTDTYTSTTDVIGGFPLSLAVSPNGNTLYAVVAGPTATRINSYSINQSTGVISSVGSIVMSASYTAGRQCALSPDGTYLYVTNFDNSTSGVSQKVYIINVSNPASMSVANSFTVGQYLWGIAVKPDGTRLYVGSRNPSAYAIYVYDISGAKKTAPTLVPSTTINLASTKDPTYLAVNTDGSMLFARVFETVDPGDGARKDIEVYNITNPAPLATAEVYKIDGNIWRNSLPGNHQSTGSDIDTNNAFEGMALSPDGWFMYFGHWDGASNSGRSYWNESIYGTSVANITSGDGFDRKASSEIWSIWGGLSDVGTWEGWHSSDGIITTKNHKVYFTYSDDTVTPETFRSVTTTTDANTAPTAPVITYPLAGATGVTAPIAWNQSQDYNASGVDDSSTLTYTVQIVPAASLESGYSTWQLMSYTAPGVTSANFVGVLPGVAYYARVQAYDGTYVSTWSYTGPFTIDPNFLSAPTWESYYKVASHEAVINWAAVTGANAYVVGYKVHGSGGAYNVTGNITTWYNASDTNPNTWLSPSMIPQLTQLTTYDVAVAAKNTVTGVQSAWSSPSEEVYTLERPWVDDYNPTNTSVNIIWGPEVSTATSEIPLAVSYQMQYLTGEATGWQMYAGTLDNTNYQSATNQLVFPWTGLIPGITYEVQMRSVDNTGGVSDWSTQETGILTFRTIRAPWWINASNIIKNGSTATATLEWDVVPSTIGGFQRYEYSYGTDALGTNLGIHTPSGGNSSTIEGLSSLTIGQTYYVKVRAVYTAGYSDWSPITSFIADPFYAGPLWTGSYAVTSHEAVINWGSVEGATAYHIQYKTSSEANWHDVTVEGAVPQYNPSDVNPNYQLTFLTRLSTYDVQVCALRYIAGGTPTVESQFTPINLFYTLERPWVDFYKPTDHSVYIVWGPEVSINDPSVPQNVPQGVSYQMQYRTSQAGGWQNYTAHPLTFEHHERPVQSVKTEFLLTI